MKIKFLIILTLAFLTACGGQATETPAPLPTDRLATATLAPTDTAVPTATIEPTIAPTETAVPSVVSFTKDILPILKNRCEVCHGGTRGTEEGLDLGSFSDLMAGSDNGPVVIAGDADNSLIVKMLVEQKMPKRGPKLTPSQVQLIVDWINQGAPYN